jgi:hypothetical protein
MMQDKVPQTAITQSQNKTPETQEGSFRRYDEELDEVGQ